MRQELQIMSTKHVLHDNESRNKWYFWVFQETTANVLIKM